MPFHEHRRLRRTASVDSRPPEETALARAILLARAFRWREEWRAEVAARAERTNGHAIEQMVAKTRRRTRDPAEQFAAAIARDDFGRFYWTAELDEQLSEARRSGSPKKRRRTGNAKQA
jgi:hypothetical protein